MAQYGLLRKLDGIGMFFVKLLVFASSARKNIWKRVLECNCFTTLYVYVYVYVYGVYLKKYFF